MQGGKKSIKITFFLTFFLYLFEENSLLMPFPEGTALPLFDFHLKGISTSKVKIVDS